MCDIDSLLDIGLVNALDSIAMLYGEYSALMTSENPDLLTFYEICEYSKVLSCQLYYRMGSRKQEKILLICDNHVAAEIVSIISCARIGAIFLPVDIKWLDNIEFFHNIILDVGANTAIVVAESEYDYKVIQLEKVGVRKIVLLGADGSINPEHTLETPNIPENEVEFEKELNQPFYLLYTSGTTGIPKAVIGTEIGLLNRLKWQFERFPWQSGEVACRRTPLTFVDSLAEIFGALLGAVPLWIPERNVIAKDGLNAIINEASDAMVTRLTVLPSQLWSLINFQPDIHQLWPTLKLITVSGESVQQVLIDRFSKVMPHSTLLNLYGSTEVAGDVTYAVLHRPLSGDRDDDNQVNSIDRGTSALHHNPQLTTATRDVPGSVPIGFPIVGNDIILATESSEGKWQIVPKYCPGELFVTGIHVALGYHNRPKETESKFMRDPFGNANEEEAIYFRTGDLAVQREADNALLWLGRVDRQVKVRGVRVELDAVERAVLAVLQTSSGAAALADYLTATNTNTDVEVEVDPKDDQDNSHSQSTSQHFNSLHIVVFVESAVLVSAGYMSSQSLQSKLLQSLSSALIPSLILTIDALPRTRTGKIDYSTLKSHIGPFTVRKEHTSTITNSTVYQLQAQSVPSENETGIHSDPIRPSIHSDRISHIISILYDVYVTTLPSLRVLPPALSGPLLPAKTANSNAAQPSFNSISIKDVASSNSNTNTTTIGHEGSDIDYQDWNFFDLGGDSMSSIEARWLVRRGTGVAVTLEELGQPLGILAQIIEGRLSPSECECDIVDPPESTGSAGSGGVSRKRYRDFSPEDNDEIPASATAASAPSVSTSLPIPINSRLNITALIPHANRWQWQWRGKAGIGNGDRGKNGTAPTSASLTIKEEALSLQLVWSVTLKKCVDATPLLVHSVKNNKDEEEDDEVVEIVYIGSHGGDFLAINAANGTTLWTLELGQHIEGSAAIHIEPPPSSVSLVYIGSYCDLKTPANSRNEFPNATNSNEVEEEEEEEEEEEDEEDEDDDEEDEEAVVEAETTKLIAEKGRANQKLQSELDDTSPVDPMLRATASSSDISPPPHPPPPPPPPCQGTLWAIDMFSGQVQWVYRTQGEIKGTPVMDAVTADHPRLWVGCHDHGLYLLHATTGNLTRRLECAGAVFGGPLLVPASNLIVAASTDVHGTVQAFSTQSLELLWVYRAGAPIFSTPTWSTGSRSIVLGVVDGTLRNISETGGEVWAVAATRPVFSTATVGFLSRYSDEVVEEQQVVVWGCHDSFLRCSKLTDGCELWKVGLGAIIFSTPCIWNNIICVATTAGILYVIDLTNGSILSTLQMNGECYSSPVVHNNMIYVGCRDDQLRCVKF